MKSREPNPAHDSLTPYVLEGIAKEEGLDLEFYNEALKRMEEDDSILPLFTKAMVEISTALSMKNMTSDYQRYVQVSVIGDLNELSSILTLEHHRLSSYTRDIPLS